jgi:hypothetical protein
MAGDVYHYSFSPHVPVEDIEATLLLALWGAESLHGEAQVRLDAAHFLDASRRAAVLDARSPVGRDVNRLFVGFIRREFGEGGFQVSRVDAVSTRSTEEATACP